MQESRLSKEKEDIGAIAASKLLNKEAELSFLQGQYAFKEKQIDSETKIGNDKWKVKATYTYSPAYRADDKNTTTRTYILTKDAGKIRIAEVRTECENCGGDGYETCYLCSGDGRDYNDSYCSECDGAGRTKCED
jgi:hypothetical protein